MEALVVVAGPVQDLDSQLVRPPVLAWTEDWEMHRTVQKDDLIEG